MSDPAPLVGAGDEGAPAALGVLPGTPTPEPDVPAAALPADGLVAVGALLLVVLGSPAVSFAASRPVMRTCLFTLSRAPAGSASRSNAVSPLTSGPPDPPAPFAPVPPESADARFALTSL